MDAARASVRDTELTIWQQVEGSWVTLIEAEERIGAAQKAVQSAEENFRLFQGRFDAGVGNIIELTDAQFALTQAQFNVLRILRGAHPGGYPRCEIATRMVDREN